MSTEEIGLFIKVLRPRQWPKNLIALLPVLFAIKIQQLPLVLSACVCVFSLCLLSGSIYILNDVLDSAADKMHPSKRFRPIASGKLSTHQALAFSLLCLVSGLFISYLVRPTLCIVEIAYVLLNLSYVFFLKQHAILDVLSIATSFVLRAFAGAVAVKVGLSCWFLLCTSFGAIYLALEKRRQEVSLLGENSINHRKALEFYSTDVLNRLEGIVLPSLLMSYAFYSFLSFHGQWMMLTVPFVLYGIMRYLMLSLDGKLTGSPEEVFWKDRPMQITLLLWLLTCGLVVYGAPEILLSILRTVDSVHFVN